FTFYKLAHTAMKHFQIYLFFLVCTAHLTCNNKKVEDVSHIDLNIIIERFDMDLDQAGIDTAKHADLREKYTWFYRDYMSGMLAIGHPSDPEFYSQLQEVMKDPDYIALKESTARAFPDLKKQETELTDAFKRIKYHFPEQKLPKLISFI